MSGALIRGEYPADWPAIALEVKEHAGWRCIRCAHPHAPEVGRCLTVHHLDGDKGNCRWWNLLALCQACHLSVQGRVQVAQVYLWEHSEWFKSYAAGYYAWSVLGLETNREAVERGGGIQRLIFLKAGQPWLALE